MAPKPKFSGHCGFCHKYDHKRADCHARQKQQGGIHAIDWDCELFPDLDENWAPIWDTHSYTICPCVDASAQEEQQQSHAAGSKDQSQVQQNQEFAYLE